ncbi:MAG: HNH endonuclease family protein, partial [Deltaproteobacteria bacterium]
AQELGSLLAVIVVEVGMGRLAGGAAGAFRNPRGEATYDYPIISVEHVLPQNPSKGSVWLKWFPMEEERAQYTHRIGNLALLSRKKNAQAQNYDFDKKKEGYFATSKGVSPFALTTQVLQKTEWTPAIINDRQKDLLQKLKTLWRL